MSNNTESQCYIAQLQIDNYLDGDLSENQQENFLQHVNACAECAAEFRYAQTIQDGLLDLPLLDCSEQALQAARELAGTAEEGKDGKPGSFILFIAETLQWFGAAPSALRYAIPVLLLATVAMITLPQLAPERQLTDGAIPVATIQAGQAVTTQVDYSPEEVAQALQDLTLAIEYLNEVSERTESMVGGRFLMRPLQNRLNASFERVRTNVQSEISGEEI